MQTPPLAFFPQNRRFLSTKKKNTSLESTVPTNILQQAMQQKELKFFYLVLPSLFPYIDLRTHTTPDLVFPSKE